MDATPDEVLRVLADPERLAIAGAIGRAPMEANSLAERLDIPLARVHKHLAKLTTAGLARVQKDRRTYVLDAEILRQVAKEVGPSREPGLALGAATDDEETVLRQYFRGGVLREIPAKESKRRVVLERLAWEFEPGIRYPEKEINATLKRFHPDYASLRRYLVDEGFLSREGGEYWRSGGWVE